MSVALESLCWPRTRVAEAIEALALHAGFHRRHGRAVVLPHADRLETDLLAQLIVTSAAQLDIEVEPLDARYEEASALLKHAGPLLIELNGSMVAMRSVRRRMAVLVGPDQRLHTVPLTAMEKALRAPLAAGFTADVASVIDAVELPASRREAACERLLAERLCGQPLRGIWALRRASWTSFSRQLGDAGVWGRTTLLVAGYAALVAVWITAWWLLGQGVLLGRRDDGWLSAWGLLFATFVPLRFAVVWLQADLSVRIGVALKQRLLVGALRIDPDALRVDGAGQMLGRTIEAAAVEELLLSGGLSGVGAVLELAAAVWLLGVGAGGALHVALVVLVTGLVLLLGRQLAERQRIWTDHRLAMTNDLVEQMVGHRTRMVQQREEEWHTGEDEAATRALQLARRMDRTRVWLGAVPRLWLVAALSTLAPIFIVAQRGNATLALAVAGLLFTARALEKLVAAASDLIAAGIGWRRVAPLFNAAVRPPDVGVPERALVPSANDGALDAHGLAFTHSGRRDAALTAVSLTIRSGERLLVQGASGSGKSTLAAILAGLRRPSAGALVAGGLDLATLGVEGWRRRVVLAPQYHENHIITETLAFNVLLGRRWPPRPHDLSDARAILEELGLGPVLARMPGDLMQMVGEGGWQLSHGERSRVYLARALLQGAGVVILDESLGALDPETMGRVMRCLFTRAKTLVLIAHP